MDLCTTGLFMEGAAAPAMMSERLGTEMEISKVVSLSFSISSVSLSLLSLMLLIHSQPSLILLNSFLKMLICMVTDLHFETLILKITFFKNLPDYPLLFHDCLEIIKG